jgi:hypothetical protein
MSRRRKWFEGPRAPVVIAWRAHCLERARNPAQQTLAMVVRHAFSRDTSDTCGSCRPRRTLSWTILGLFLALMRQTPSHVPRSSLRGGRRRGDGDVLWGTRGQLGSLELRDGTVEDAEYDHTDAHTNDGPADDG